MKNFRDLKVWTKAHELTLAIYRCTGSFPTQEQYGLTSQMRRCSASIGANIAEGCGRSNSGDFNRFLQMALGSSCELEYQLLLSKDLGFLEDSDYSTLNAALVELKRMLMGLNRKVELDRFSANG